VWERNNDGNWFAVKQARTGSYLKAVHDAQAALDAMLDVLEANADEWAYVWDTNDTWEKEQFKSDQGKWLVASLSMLRRDE
jgi:hypothetical protein